MCHVPSRAQRLSGCGKSHVTNRTRSAHGISRINTWNLSLHLTFLSHTQLQMGSYNSSRTEIRKLPSRSAAGGCDGYRRFGVVTCLLPPTTFIEAAPRKPIC